MTVAGQASYRLDPASHPCHVIRHLASLTHSGTAVASSCDLNSCRSQGSAAAVRQPPVASCPFLPPQSMVAPDVVCPTTILHPAAYRREGSSQNPKCKSSRVACSARSATAPGWESRAVRPPETCIGSQQEQVKEQQLEWIQRDGRFEPTVSPAPLPPPRR